MSAWVGMGQHPRVLLSPSSVFTSLISATLFIQSQEYLNMGGIPEFCRLSAQLAFGEGSAALKEGRVATVQGLSGTGSLRVRCCCCWFCCYFCCC